MIKSFMTEAISSITTTPATFGSARVFQTASLISTNLEPIRSVQLRKIAVKFSPFITATSTLATQTLFAQLAYNNVDGTVMPMTPMQPLSTTEITQLSFTLKRDLAEFRTGNDTGPLLSVYIYNPLQASALAQYVPLSIRATWDLVDDFPNLL
jgi:hypothetical protein